jgi:general secretion pathway protein J
MIDSVPVYEMSIQPKITHRKSDTGFTLLELLIALTLSTLVMLMLTLGMHTVLKEWSRSSNRLDESLDKVLVLLQIERALEGAFPHLYYDSDEKKQYIFFQGEEEKIAWVSMVSPKRQPGLTAWQINPNDEEEGGIEIRIARAFASDPTEQLEEHTTPIPELAGYKAYFEYLYVHEKIKEDTKWLTEWDGEKWQRLPSAVRLRLESENGDVGESLEIVAVIRAYQHRTKRPNPVKP